MRAAHHHRLGVLARFGDERCNERVCLAEEQVRSAAALECEAGVDDVARRQAEVDEAPARANGLGDLADEGDHVVVGRQLELGDTVDVDARL